MTGVLIQPEVRIRPHSSFLLSSNLGYRDQTGQSQLDVSPSAGPQHLHLPGSQVEIPTPGFRQPRHINHQVFPLMDFSHPQREWFPSGWEFLKNPLFREKKSTSVAEFHHPTLLYPSPSPAQIFPLNCERRYHWSSLFKPEKKVICHFCSGPSTPNKTYNHHKVPHKNCWKGFLSLPTKGYFFPLPTPSFPQHNEETTFAHSSGRDQMLETSQQRNASESPPFIWCPRD